MIIPRPTEDEYAPGQLAYIERVPVDVDPLEMMRSQLETVPRLLKPISEAQAYFRYGPDKWSIKEVVGHLSDTERILACRLLRIARADQTPLPGFDEDDYVRTAHFDTRSLASLTDEWGLVRRATLALVTSVQGSAWAQRGIANAWPSSARALAYVIAGHVAHHVDLLQTRYGIG